MRGLIRFILGVGIIILSGFIMLWLSGMLTGLLVPIADLLGWLTANLSGPPEVAAQTSTMLLFLFFRVPLLPYWTIHHRVNRVTGEVMPDFDTMTRMPSIQRNRACARLVLLLLLGVFYFVVLRASEHGVATWPASRLRDGLGSNFIEVCVFLVLLLIFIYILMLIFASASRALLSRVLSGTKASGTDGHVTFLHGSTWNSEAQPIFVTEWSVFCAVLLVTHIVYKHHHYTGYLVGGYVQAMVFYVPIWSAGSTFMDWRNDRWVASLVRESRDTADPAVQRAAASKLAKLDSWAQKK